MVAGLPPDYHAIGPHAVDERRRGTDAQHVAAAVPRGHDRLPPMALTSSSSTRPRAPGDRRADEDTRSRFLFLLRARAAKVHPLAWVITTRPKSAAPARWPRWPPMPSGTRDVICHRPATAQN